MQIEVSESALKQLELHKRQNAPRMFVKIAYDTEGCGCAVNGVVQLWQVNQLTSDDHIAFDGPVTLIYDQRQEVFFEDHIRLDYNESSAAFSLKSHNQIYNPSMQIMNKMEVEQR